GGSSEARRRWRVMSRTTLKTAVNRLLAMAKQNPQFVLKSGKTSMLCKGMDWDSATAAVCESIPDEYEEVFSRVLAAVAERNAQPRYMVWDQEQEKEVPYEKQHHFVEWILGLIEGAWSLPERVPREALEAFASCNGCVMRRCEICLMGLANGRPWSNCPVCGSDRLSYKETTGPPWDSNSEYTPQRDYYTGEICYPKRQK